jgi:hypothetical protein
MTIRQLTQRNFARAPLAAEMRWAAVSAAAGSESRPGRAGKLRPARDTVYRLPDRPDSAVLSDSIPLFYIGRNAEGYWIAREANGQRGGLFLLKGSAMRFARYQIAPRGGAMIFLSDPLELDVENQGSSLAEALIAAGDIVRRRVPAFAAFVAAAIAAWSKLVARISRGVADERRNRTAIERELFHGEYRLSSKSDDDLPIP